MGVSRERARRRLEKVEPPVHGPGLAAAVPAPAHQESTAGGAGADHTFSEVAVLPPEPAPAELETDPDREPLELSRVAGPVVQRAPDPAAPPDVPGEPPPAAPPPGDPQSGGGGGGGSTTITLKPSTRTVSATSLSALWDVLTRSGTREAASVLPKFTPDPQYEYDGNDRVTKAVVTVVEQKEMPQWQEADTQCPPIKAEWTRYIGVLDAHENRHVDLDRQHFTNVHLKLVGKKREDAWATLDGVITAADAANQAYDTTTQHGITEGARINSAVQCEPEKVKSTGTGMEGARDEGFFSRIADTIGGMFQAKLEVGPVGDALEQEAEAVAERVVSGGVAWPGRSPKRAEIRRSCAGPGHCQCEHCKEEEEERQRSRASGRIQRSPSGDTCLAPGACDCPRCAKERESNRARQGELDDQAHRGIQAVTAGSAERLDRVTQGHMESRLGHDFSRVRIHADPAAARSASMLRARAYTLGQDIVFGAGQYAPGTLEGQRLLAHELTHVVQQGQSEPLVQRAPNDSPTPNPAPAAPNSGAADLGDLIDRDRKAFEAAKARVGKPAATVLTDVPKSPADVKGAEVFTIQDIMDRSGGVEDSRKGFETQGLASAYAAMNARPTGAVVLQQDGVFFAARLNANPKLELIAQKPAMPSPDWKMLVFGPLVYGGQLLGSDWNKYTSIYRIDPAPGVLTVVGQDGILFPATYFQQVSPEERHRGLNPSSSGGMPSDLSGDPSKTSQIKADQLPSAPNAADLRSLAGLTDPRAKSEVKPEQQQAFITSYFKARAAESLDANEKTAEQLASDFKPAGEKEAAAPGSKVSQNAARLMESSRKLAKNLRTILETQALIQARLDYVETAISRAAPGHGPILRLNMDGKEHLAVDLKDKYREALKEIAAAVIQIRSSSPMLALMVPEERETPPITASQVAIAGLTAMGGVVAPGSTLPQLATDKSVQDSIQNKVRAPAGKNQVDASLFGQAQSPENDEKMRREFEKKLDASRQAIRRARSEILHGNQDLLFGLPGLRRQVEADLSKSEPLKGKLKEILDSHEVNEIVWKVAETTVQVGSLFLPGGAFLSAAIGFGMAARDFGKDLQKWDIAQAGAIDPATALISQQEAQEALVMSTLTLALSAMDLGSAIAPEFQAAKGVMAADAEGAAKGFTKEIKGIPDALGGETHELGMTSLGITRCSPAPGCLILAESLQWRGKKLMEIPADADVNWFMLQGEIEPKLTKLQGQAESINKRALESLKLPEPKQSAEQAKLLREAHAVELEMWRLEHRVYSVRGHILPAAHKSEWLPRVPGGKVVAGEGFWKPASDTHRAFRFVEAKGPVPYDRGFPNLSKWSDMDVGVVQLGKNEIDFAKADELGAIKAFERNPRKFGSGRPLKPDVEKFTEFRQKFEYTWHHNENGNVLQLVPRDLHNSLPHIGGGSFARGIPVPPK